MAACLHLEREFPARLHYHPLVIDRHQACKQADTVLAMLLPDLFTKEEKRTAFAFYDSVTTHEVSFDLILPGKLKGYGLCVWTHGRLVEVCVSAENVSYKPLEGEESMIIDRAILLHLNKE